MNSKIGSAFGFSGLSAKADFLFSVKPLLVGAKLFFSGKSAKTAFFLQKQCEIGSSGGGQLKTEPFFGRQVAAPTSQGVTHLL